MKPLFENRHQQVNRNGNGNLGAHGIFAGTVESFDPQMLFDPFEEQLDLPARAVDLRYRQRRQAEVVGQKYQRLTRLGIAIADAANHLGIGALNIETVQNHRLVETQTGAFVHEARIPSSAAEILPRASDKESPVLVDPVQSSKIQVSSVHNVEGTGLVGELVQNIDVVDTAGCDNKFRRDVALQVEQGMQLDAAFASPEGGPGKQRQAQVDGGGVQGIGGLLDFGRQRFVRVESGSLLNEHLSKVAKDAPIAQFVGIGQSAAGGRLANAAVVELGTQSAQARFDIAQTLAPGQLREGHDDKLFVGEQFADAEVAAISLNTLVEFVFGQAVQQLGENRTTFVHMGFGPPSSGAKPCEIALRS